MFRTARKRRVHELHLRGVMRRDVDALGYVDKGATASSVLADVIYEAVDYARAGCPKDADARYPLERAVRAASPWAEHGRMDEELRLVFKSSLMKAESLLRGDG